MKYFDTILNGGAYDEDAIDPADMFAISCG